MLVGNLYPAHTETWAMSVGAFPSEPLQFPAANSQSFSPVSFSELPSSAPGERGNDLARAQQSVGFSSSIHYTPNTKNIQKLFGVSTNMGTLQ